MTVRAVDGVSTSSRRGDAATARLHAAEQSEERTPACAADEVLVQRILAGDEHAFELLMRRHNQTLFRAARGVVHDATEAEDVVQEAYMKAFRALGRFEGRSSLATWLVRIVINEARTRARRESRAVSIDEVSGADGELADDAALHATGWIGTAHRGPEDAVGNDELRAVLSQAVDGLPENLRTVFVLRCVEGMSVAETADSLDLTGEVVRIRLHRARAALREDIGRKLSKEARRLFSFGHDRCDRVVALVLERLREERA